MSSFRDAFTKDDESGNVLGYDDDASLFFGATCVICIAFVWTFNFLFRFRKKTSKKSFLLRLWSGDEDQLEEVRCQCSFCKKKAIARKENFVSEINASSKWRRLEFVGLMICWIILGLLVWRISLAPEALVAFDPFRILEISESASTPDIRRAYRRLSLKFHPDQNPNDPTAQAKFVLISKAYQSLTDEVSKANYQKYGNPDGRSMMKMGIGLPKFLVQQEFQLFILAAFFIVILFIIPLIFILYYQKQQKFAPNGVRISTLQTIGKNLKQDLNIHKAVEIISAAAEFQEIGPRDSDHEELKALEPQVAPGKAKCEDFFYKKSWILLHAHLKRKHDSLSPSLQKDLDTMLRMSPKLVGAMLEVALMNRWIQACKNVVHFRQCLVQALDATNNEFLQIPHITQQMLMKQKGNKNPQKILQHPSLSEQDRADAVEFLRNLPVMKMEAKFEVEGEEKVVISDIGTLTVKLNRTKLEENQVTAAVHAPFYPDVKREEWLVFVIDSQSGQLLTFGKTKDPRKHVELKLQWQIANLGKHHITVLAMCDSFIGVEIPGSVVFMALHPEQAKREAPLTHPDDAALDYQPNLLQHMLGQEGAQSEGSDSE